MAVQACCEWILRRMTVRPDHNDGQLYKPRQNGSDRSADDPQRRCTEFPENQDIIKQKIHKYRHDACRHRYHGLSAFTQRACISLHQRKWKQPHHHDVEIVFAEFQRLFQISFPAAFMEKSPNQIIAPECENHQKRRCQTAAHRQLEAEGMTHSVVIPAAVELRPQDAGSCHDAEYADVKHKQDLICNGHAGHRLRSDLSDHDIIQHPHEIGDCILNDNRHNDHQHLFIKSPVSNKGGQAVFFPESFL